MKTRTIKLFYLLILTIISLQNGCIEFEKEPKLAENIYVEYLIAEIDQRGIPSMIKYICEWYVPNKYVRKDIYQDLREREVLITMWRGNSWRFYPHSNLKTPMYETLPPFYVEYEIPKSIKEIKREELKDIGYGYFLYKKTNEKKEIEVEYDEKFGNITTWFIKLRKGDITTEIKPICVSYKFEAPMDIISQLKKANDLEREIEKLKKNESERIDIKQVLKINKENREKIKRILKFYPNYSNGYIDLGHIEAMENNIGLSERYFRKAIEIDAENIEAYLSLLGLLKLTRSDKDSIKIAKIVELKFSQNNEFACISLAEFYKSKNMKKEAIKFYDKAIEIIKKRLKEDKNLETILEKVEKELNHLRQD